MSKSNYFIKVMNPSKSYLDVSLPNGYYHKTLPFKTNNSMKTRYQTNPHSSILHTSIQNKVFLNSSYNQILHIDKNYPNNGNKLNETINSQYKRGINSQIDLIDFRMNYELVQAKLARLDHLLNDKNDKRNVSNIPKKKEKLYINKRDFKHRFDRDILLNKIEFNPDNSTIRFEKSQPILNIYNSNFNFNKQLKKQKDIIESDDNLDEIADNIVKSIEIEKYSFENNVKTDRALEKNYKDSSQSVEISALQEKTPKIGKQVFKMKDGSFLSDNNNSSNQKQKLINGNDHNCAKEQIQAELSNISLQFLQQNNSEKDNVTNDEKKDDTKKNQNITNSESKIQEGDERIDNVTESNKMDTVLSSTVKEMIVPCNFEQLLKDEEKIPKNECFMPTDITPMSSRENTDKNNIRNDIILNDINYLPEKPYYICKTEEKKNYDTSELNTSRKRVTFNDKKKIINYGEKKNVKDFKKELIEAIGDLTEIENDLNKSQSKNRNKKLKSILIKKNFGLENLPVEEEIKIEQTPPPLIKKKKFNAIICKHIQEIRQMELNNKEYGVKRVSKDKKNNHSRKKGSSNRKLKNNQLKYYTSPYKIKEVEGTDHNKLKTTFKDNETIDHMNKGLMLKINKEPTSEILKNLGFEKMSRTEKQNLLKEMLASFNNESSKNYKISESNDEDKNIVNISYLSDDISNLKSKESLGDRVISPQSLITYNSNIDRLPSQSIINKTVSSMRKSPNFESVNK